MSIETEFESTITNVKNAYQGLDNLGATIPQNKTIENIKNCLDEIYNKFPKTDYAEGSNITLSNTLKGKLDFEDGIVGYGQTEQKSTTGKNKLQFPYIETSKTDRGITYVVNNDGTITVSGTATDNSVITLLNQNSTEFSNIRNLLLNNDCILNGCPSGGSNTSYRLQLYGYTSGGAGALADYGSGVSLSNFANETNTFNVAIFIPTGTVISTPITFKPMIRLASVTDDTYEEYTNGASPSPSYPQDIEVVRGKNRLPLNEADFTTTFYGQNVEIKDEVIKISGSATEVYSIMVGKNGLVTPTDTNRITFKVNSGTYKYTQFTSGTSYSGINVRLKDEDTNIMYTTGSTITLTETHTFSINIFMADTDSKNAEIKIQLEKGSQATSYLPYNTLEVGIRNANLAKSKYVNPAVSSYLVVLQADFDIKPSTTYTISFNGREGNKVYFNEYLFDGPATQTYLTIGSGRTIRTITTKDTISDTQKNSDGWYIFKNQAGNTEANIFDDLQIETGSTATDYEPYQTPQTYQLSLGEYEFAKIGNYVDTIEYDVENDKVYKNKNVNEHTFTESENISLQSINSYGIANFFIPHSLGSVSNLALCNYFTLQTSGISVTQEEGFLWQHNGVYFRIKSSTASDVSSFKTWLGSHSVKTEYALAETNKEEITTILKDQIKALYYSHSFTGTTIIEINGQLPLIIKVRALKGE